MKIAFDFHGVVERNPDSFMKIFKILRKMGFEVGIVSGPPILELYTKLVDCGFDPLEDHMDFVYSIVTYLKEENIHLWKDEKGNWWTDDYSWWSAKSKICEKYGIDILVDDKAEYGEYVNKNTKFILLDDNFLIDMLGE